MVVSERVDPENLELLRLFTLDDVQHLSGVSILCLVVDVEALSDILESEAIRA
jgi:hypothetical protein